MSARSNVGQFFTVARYGLFSRPASVWLLPIALCLFVFGFFWRTYLGGKQDTLFFQILSLTYCWYIYIAGVMATLNGLRKNTSCFFIDNLKRASFFVGFLSSSIINLLNFIFLVEIDAAGFIFLLVYLILFLSFSNTWNKWRDVSRLAMTGLFPFVLINGYLKINTLLDASIIWMLVFWLTVVALFISINISYYRMWMSKPRNFNPASDDYAVTQHYYQKRSD